MTDCPATATIQLGGELCTAICNLPPGHHGPHEDIVLGEWGSPETAAPARG
ncbi:hypothetical protein OG455_41300 [Kitasatospora sp. NBC_01287]|uniref:hypothetical protein n=1 Tax=Kitasatospora sp. NBC_01287 TaxID=2903573 RepID=UPI002253D146|nr:hypothetical protein [Kitasatospora sp. NBC_01287]MCX4750920.1 hypothetical protein [Kitasatospora sp. NBC_01287]MCX4751829.1 hypothetical protein [Kitasatospora sp. NBC_01287]MCX4751879.1 hypothetical protein [Kitasatospora sp. NBC_01287]